MKCPYRKNTIYVYSTYSSESRPELTEEIKSFEECYKVECPFYRYKKSASGILIGESCRRVESEVKS